MSNDCLLQYLLWFPLMDDPRLRSAKLRFTPYFIDLLGNYGTMVRCSEINEGSPVEIMAGWVTAGANSKIHCNILSLMCFKRAERRRKERKPCNYFLEMRHLLLPIYVSCFVIRHKPPYYVTRVGVFQKLGGLQIQ